MKSVDPLQQLKRFVEAHPDQRTAASALGLSQAFLNDILHGKRGVPQRVYETIGIRLVAK